MRRTGFFSSLRLLSLIAIGGASVSARGTDDPTLDALWKDPVFKRQFVGGYGINADIEPRVTPEEVALLEKVRPLMADNLVGAENLLRKQMKPECSAILDYTLGSLQFQQEKLPEALATFQKAVGKFPTFRRAWRNLGLIQTRTGNYDEAIRSFVRMIELGGSDGLSFGLLGFAYAQKQDWQPAEAAYRNALLMQPDNAEWRLGLTRCVCKEEKFEDAAGLLSALLERFPDNAGFWLLSANTYIGLKQPLKAAQSFEIIDRLGKSSPENLHTLGDIYLSENLPGLAASRYQRAIDLDPKQPAARPLRSAELLAARGAVDEAQRLIAHIREVCEPNLDDGARRKLLKLQARLSMANGAGDDASVGVLEDIVKLDPLDGEALMLLGQHYAKVNEPDRAILYYERAESIDSFEAQAKLRHAQVLVSMSRYTDALPLLRRAQEVKSREDVARYLEQVERLAKAHR